MDSSDVNLLQKLVLFIASLCKEKKDSVRTFLNAYLQIILLGLLKCKIKPVIWYLVKFQ